jgi:hypothetical protein
LVGRAQMERRARRYACALVRCRRRFALSFALRRAARSAVREWRLRVVIIASPFRRSRRGADVRRRGVRPYHLTPRRLAPRDGFEPSTQRLTAACSTTELPGIRAHLASGASSHRRPGIFAGITPAAALAPIGRRHIGQACRAPQACWAPRDPQNWTLPSEGGARRTGAGRG